MPVEKFKILPQDQKEQEFSDINDLRSNFYANQSTNPCINFESLQVLNQINTVYYAEKSAELDPEAQNKILQTIAEIQNHLKNFPVSEKYSANNHCNEHLDKIKKALLH
ncbi:MAG TPA: hypothetical protein PLQ36_01965 [Candidatus Gracilibacteria bacterium]|nr:hypothetical protein [Candidatus Gracilibacteria bacterium]